MEERKPQRGRPLRKTIHARFAATISLVEEYGGIPSPNEARELWTEFWHMDTHHSTAIEGNTLLLKEVEALLAEGRTVGGKELKDYLEVLGYSEAADWVYRQGFNRETWQHDELIRLARSAGPSPRDEQGLGRVSASERLPWRIPRQLQGA